MDQFCVLLENFLIKINQDYCRVVRGEITKRLFSVYHQEGPEVDAMESILDYLKCSFPDMDLSDMEDLWQSELQNVESI